MHKQATLALAALLLPMNLGALGDSTEGHWELLGEDGAIFVPKHPPATAAYLPPPDLGAFHNASEMVATLTSLAASRPDLLSVETAGTSVQGRPILRATLTAPGDATGRTRVLFDGAHHGDEVIASEVLIRFLQRTIAQYDTNASMRAALGQVVVDVVPMVNPDGIDFVPQCSHYAQCRKNARGVDLNRNYPSHWGEPGSSGNPGDATYRGPAPASEPETRVIRDLLDAHPYALYASFHSGAEMILWPWGWTTAAPPEEAVYQQLGGELSAITGAPHGQVSRILYGVSGDSMDQAYGSAAGWRAIAISPETYEGSGNAFDWWYLFNPPETEAGIAPVAARWDRFLWHMVAQAPAYAPATIAAPHSLALGPGAGNLDATVAAASRRPLLGASLALTTEPSVVSVLGANPVTLANQSAPQSRTFSLLPLRGGSFDANLELRAGPAGLVKQSVRLELVQVGLSLALESATMGSPDTNHATVVVDAGPFASLAGSVALVAEPGGVLLGTAAFGATRGAPAELDLAFQALALRGGNHTVVARATFTAVDDEGGEHPGELTASAPLLVLRPQIDLDKRFSPSTPATGALPVTTIFRNSGTLTAKGLVVRETIPLGYSWHTRDGPVPVPLDPLGRPIPTTFEPQPDGSLVAAYALGDVPPGQQRFVQYRLLTLVPGTYALASAWSYGGDFASGAVAYDESAAPAHTIR